MAFIENGRLIRRCIKCLITSDLVEFLIQKNSKNGKMYTHNICLPCRRWYNFTKKYKNISKKEHSKRAQEWNRRNRERYNARRRVRKSGVGWWSIRGSVGICQAT